MWKATSCKGWFVCRKGWIAIAAALGVGMILDTRPQPPAGYTGAPHEGTCRTCHELRGGSPIIHLSVLPNQDSLKTYTPGGPPLRLRLQASYEGAAYYGFSLTILDDTGGAWPAYSLQAGPEVALQKGPFERRYLGHWGWSEDGAWEFEWQPPAHIAGTLHWYIGVVAANGDQTITGDWTAMKHLRVEPAFRVQESPFFLQGGLLWLKEPTAQVRLYDLSGRWLTSYVGVGPHPLPAVGVVLLVLESGDGTQTVHRLFLP